MIRLARGPAPQIFNSIRARVLYEDAAKFYAEPARRRSQLKYSSRRLEGFLSDHLMLVMRDRFPKKCAYCEMPLEYPIVDSFRPMRMATNLDGTQDDDHYWWLAFEWSNYLPACKMCSFLKGPRFPVLGKRCTIGAVGNALKSEKRLLLDPCADEPTKVLLFLDDGRVTSEDARGPVTIDILGLNRDQLVSDRSRDLKKLLGVLGKGTQSQAKVADTVRTLTEMTNGSSPFAAMRRQYAKAWAIEVAESRPASRALTARLRMFRTPLSVGLGDSYSTIKKASAGLTKRTLFAESYSVGASSVSLRFYRQARFIEKIELRNIRAFKDLELTPDLTSGEEGGWFVLLGENGTGKSSLLQAVACALVGQAGLDALGMTARDLLRRGCTKGEVRVHLTGMSVPVVMTMWRRDNRIEVVPAAPKIMVLAYGATRLLTKGMKHQARPRAKVDNLFDPLSRLNTGRPWLEEASKKDFDRFARSLAELLPSPDGARFTRRAGEIFVETPGVRDTLANLSSGYQAVLALALDIMSVMRTNWADMESAEGIVLIDEIDAHLHPRWKMRIVERLRRVFPRMQFIVTSHDPLTLHGLESTEVAVLKRSLDGCVSVLTSDSEGFPSPKNMRVEQLLTSELFGLYSANDSQLDAVFEEYYKLLALRSRTPAENKRLENLRDELDHSGRMGVTLREKLALEAADEFIADRKAKQDDLPTIVKNAARARLKSIWSEIDTDTLTDASRISARPKGGSPK